jgi:tetratricopeptide (TPR) repeat protein
MSCVLRTIWLAIFGLALATALLGTQGQEEDSSQEPKKETTRYSPPPAWKSVEIGDYYLRRKKLNAALSRYQEAVKTDPYYSRGYFGLGKVYDKLGLRRKALESYKKYLDLLPSEKDALEAKDVQKAVARLERQVGSSRSHSTQSSAAGDSRPR